MSVRERILQSIPTTVCDPMKADYYSSAQGLAEIVGTSKEYAFQMLRTLRESGEVDCVLSHPHKDGKVSTPHRVACYYRKVKQ